MNKQTAKTRGYVVKLNSIQLCIFQACRCWWQLKKKWKKKKQRIFNGNLNCVCEYVNTKLGQYTYYLCHFLVIYTLILVRKKIHIELKFSCTDYLVSVQFMGIFSKSIWYPWRIKFKENLTNPPFFDIDNSSKFLWRFLIWQGFKILNVGFLKSLNSSNKNSIEMIEQEKEILFWPSFCFDI